jgi:antirestriction protein ArdC
MQAFFDAIDITTVFTGTEAYYLPPVDKVYMPSITRFHDPRNFYGVWAHELAHNAALRFMPRLFRRSLVSCGFCRFPAA